VPRSCLYPFTFFLAAEKTVFPSVVETAPFNNQTVQAATVFVHNLFRKTCTQIVQQTEKAGSFAIPMKFVGCLTKLNNTNK